MSILQVSKYNIYPAALFCENYQFFTFPNYHDLSISGCARPDKWCTNDRKDILKMLTGKAQTWQQCGRLCTDNLDCAYWSFDGYRCYLFKTGTKCKLGENTAIPVSFRTGPDTYQGERNCPKGINSYSNK